MIIEMKRNRVDNTYVDELVNVGFFDQALSSFYIMIEDACEPNDETYYCSNPIEQETG